jgi:peptidoglycan/xylan/chitin deacetylase (PgdA/CDA1 family)
MFRVALLLLYRICGPQGPEVYLQLHSNDRDWRFFGGHVEKGETPLDAVIRETKEELNLKLRPQELGEGWTPLQLLCRLRIPFGGIYLFPIEVDETFPPEGFEIREGRGGKWWPFKSLPATMSLADGLLVRLWTLRRFVLNQPYIVSPLQCPIITIDLEESRHYAGRTNNERFANRKCGLPEVIAELLAQLTGADAKATFFCVASTAKEYPDLIREIARKGHEVASHGYDHQLASTQTLAQFKEDIIISKKILEDVSGREVVGYRAAGWSWPRHANQSVCFYKALRDVGYHYDSSVIPAAIIGIPGLPTIPYQTDAGIWEFPLPAFGIPFVTKNLDPFARDGRYLPPRHTWRSSICIPYSGGVFLRCLGVRFSSLVLSYHLKKKGYAMTYVHPRELSGEDCSWIRGLDDRYLNLFERWLVGFRARRLNVHFFSLIAKHSGCSIQQFLSSDYPHQLRGASTTKLQPNR